MSTKNKEKLVPAAVNAPEGYAEVCQDPKCQYCNGRLKLFWRAFDWLFDVLEDAKKRWDNEPF